ncbi:glucan endo-1,3-beta-glucosidase 8-like [Olea europaea var. sylvestris]|uniref:glucan endo-1,3-beta-glucosidase 8-like n=1 Tax=Olea europaea var. sylvestris TaxID=158386 RepID=UPI000C1CF5A8|nr:glucan endo-1,3-beta-glucosidase 8-like [Olea europaea var. sylvestris]
MALSIITLAYCIMLFSGNVVEGTIGLNWGRMANQRLIPSMVVDLFLQNGIPEVKVFSASENVMKAFSGSGIGLTIAIPNESLHEINSTDGARDWVRTKITNFVNMNVDIKYVNVGAEPFSPSFWNQTNFGAVDALRFIQDALNEIGYGDKTKATIPHLTDVLKPNHTKPSDAEFRDDIKEKMIESLQILQENNSPFVMDVFPIYFVRQNNMDVEFAFVDGHSTYFVEDDNGLNYTNLFDFIYDSFLWAMKKAGTPDLKLVVGQIGWPTDGYPDANIANAERFYKSLLPKVASNKGTPLRPGVPIDIYIHSLSDENKMKVKFGAFQRHWGIYRNDGEPKFKIDLSGQGRDVYPTSAKGVTYMPKRWCIFNGDTSNLTKVKYAFEQACLVGDCTSLSPGGSCSHLDFNQNVSYAFNRFFQTKSQKERDDPCEFDGLGKVVPDNPSTGACIFPVEVLAAESIDTGSSMGERMATLSKLVMLLPFLLIFLAFI